MHERYNIITNCENKFLAPQNSLGIIVDHRQLHEDLEGTTLMPRRSEQDISTRKQTGKRRKKTNSFIMQCYRQMAV